eukprot:347178_1
MSTAEFHEEVPLLPTYQNKDLESPSETSTCPSDTNLEPTPNNSKHEYSLFVAICFSLNYSIGSGILGLPFEYFNSGYILGSILLIYLGILTYITYTFVMDSMQRAEAITILSKQYSISKYDLLNNPQNTKQVLSGISPQTLRSHYSFIKNEYQLSELIGMFCGKWWKLFYDISYCISILIALWSYSSLFGVSLARNIGMTGISSACDMSADIDRNSECRGLYSLYVLIFWIWTLIISLMDFTEQQSIQIFATIARVCIISLMIITSIGLIYSSWYYDGNTYEISTSYTSTGSYASSIYAWKWNGMASMIAVSAFAYGNQYCVTDIINPLSINNRTNNQHKLWSYSVIICAIVYISCGITVSLYYGKNTESPCTLAWKGFMGFTYTNTQPIWALIIEWFVVLFPAIDIGSAYPLNAATLANTVHAAIIPENVTHASFNEIDINNNNNNICSGNKKYNVLFRILICTLTAMLALIEWNFDLILSVSGAFGLLAVYGGPCVLEWKSREMMKHITNYTDLNVYKTSNTKSWTEHKSWIFVICGTALIACIAVFVDIIQTYA